MAPRRFAGLTLQQVVSTFFFAPDEEDLDPKNPGLFVPDPDSPLEEIEQRQVRAMTAKEVLRWLRDQQLITQIQLRLAAAALNEGMELGQVLEAIEDGSVARRRTATDDPQAASNRPGLSSLPAGLGPKQSLLWLRDRGSLTPGQVREAARALDGGSSLLQALLQAGADHLVQVLPRGDTPEALPLTLGQILAKNVDELATFLPNVKRKATVLQLLTEEVNGDNRKGAKRSLVLRAAELGASEEEVIAAIEQPEREPSSAAATMREMGGDPATLEDAEGSEEEEEEEDEGAGALEGQG